MDYFFDDNVKLKLTFSEEGKISLLGFSSLIYDITLLHDCIVLATVPEYEDYNFGQYFWYRKGRGIKEEHQLYLDRIRHESPLELVIIITATAAFGGFLWALIQGIEKVNNWDLNRQKLELEVQNLDQSKRTKMLDNEGKRLDNEKKRIEISKLLSDRHAMQTIERLAQRLSEYPFKAIDAHFFTGKEKDNNKNAS